MSDETEFDRGVSAEPVDGVVVPEPGEGVAEPGEAEETVDAYPVLAEVRAIVAPPTGPIPTIQAAAVAATGFVAGAAAMALVRRYGARKLAHAVPVAQTLPGIPTVRPAPQWPVGTTRTYLVNVRLIARSGE